MYFDSLFHDLESFLRTQVDLVEDDIRLGLDEYNSSFVTYENSAGISTFKGVAGALLSFLQSEYQGYHNAIDTEFDDIKMKTKLVERPGIIVIRFDEKSFFSTIYGFQPHWDYKHYNS